MDKEKFFRADSSGMPVSGHTGEGGDKELFNGCLNSMVIIILGLLICFFISLLFHGCATRTVVEVRDSIRTEVVTQTVYVKDTVPVVLPPETIRVATPDTASRIETSLAISKAWLEGGLLHHSIWNKQTAIPVPVEHKETVRDSIVYREKQVPVEVPVEKEVEKPLTWWQQLRLWWANITLAAILAAAVFGAIRLYREVKQKG